ncbi:hypothetical protein M409DRAFT_61439 [Zasmidium cellare ATCC 36951]|uniref:Uncharacterized protein n=1 Tax=Zasmidium cellare ATCC 36951 TaxID=1080233 RepID=A0A6A6BVZ0_ZASCE|nr:uncharacterized protein M409DRAFT_61439 [Zasmidium cellare ATCC 36951]KAF2158723.1 hypothetical protein M409DRAFT_61439 [Zasmidium cellare ATCC 36951]
MKGSNTARWHMLLLIAGLSIGLATSQTGSSADGQVDNDPTITDQPDGYIWNSASISSHPPRAVCLSRRIFPWKRRADPAAQTYCSGRRYMMGRWRGMFQLQNYGSTVPVEGTLKFYTTQPRQSTTSQTEYYVTQLGAYAMTHAPETFRQGAAAYRNSREWTQKQRDQFIVDANAAALRMSNEVVSVSQTESRTEEASPTSNQGSFSSETSVDQLALDSQGSAKRRRGTASQ